VTIGIFSTIFGCGLLIALWVSGVNEIDLFITGLIIAVNTAFQIFARGNVNWAERPDHSNIKKKIPTAVYSIISSAGLLGMVFFITKATANI